MQTLVRELHSFEEAFSYLAPEVQSHSRRVAEYAQALFVQAVSEELYENTPQGSKEFQEENRKLAYEAGLYHDIGKAYFPQPYQTDRGPLMEEELAVYRKHVENGAQILPQIIKGFDERKALDKKMVLDGILDHHERVDGSGYPQGKKASEISYMGQIVGLVDELDKLVMSTVSETPLEDVLDAVKEWSGGRYDPALVKLLKNSRPRLKRIFVGYRGESRALPVTDMFVKRKATRPMELMYRLIGGPEGQKAAYSAAMRFWDGKENSLSYEEVKHIISRQGIAGQLCSYFLYEACDFLRRFDVYGIPVSYVSLPLLPVFLNKKGMVKEVEEILAIGEMEPGRLKLLVPGEMVEKPAKGLLENLKKGREAGLYFVAAGVTPAQDPETLKGYGFPAVSLDISRMQPEEETAAWAEWSKRAAGIGLEVFADGVDRQKQLAVFRQSGVSSYTGLMAGDFEREQAIVDRETALRIKTEAAR